MKRVELTFPLSAYRFVERNSPEHHWFVSKGWVIGVEYNYRKTLGLIKPGVRK